MVATDTYLNSKATDLGNRESLMPLHTDTGVCDRLMSSVNLTPVIIAVIYLPTSAVLPALATFALSNSTQIKFKCIDTRTCFEKEDFIFMNMCV